METRRVAAAVGGALALFLAVQVGALALVRPFQSAGFSQVQNPQDPTNSLIYIVVLLVATGAMLVVIRMGATWLLRAFFVFASALVSWYVFAVALYPAAAALALSPTLVAGVAALLLGAALYLHPEWYVIDAVGVVMGAGAGGLFGISFGVLPALVLLVVLAVYDAISVYGTEHMLTLASGVMEMRVPVVLVIPLSASYSFLSATLPDPAAERDDGAGVEGRDGPVNGGDRGGDERGETGFDRDAVFVGLGDAVIPTVLVASAAFFAPAPSLGVPHLALNLPSLGAVVGTLVGLLVLLRMVFAGRAHAGLPLLNGGAILGYLLASAAAGVPLLTALGL